MPGIVEENEEGDQININGPWLGYIISPLDYDLNVCFPYWSIFFWTYWDSVLNGVNFRKHVQSICEAAGTTQWWYIEEDSVDSFLELTPDEFEAELKKAPLIENFSVPSYFPKSRHHIFKDSSEQVNSAKG